jgi:pimeloyl-ACP methyl ester carboxylesterase
MDFLGPAPERLPVRIMYNLERLLQGLASARESHGYADAADMVAGLRRRSPRLDAARAGFLVERNARSLPNDRIAWPHDPSFFQSSPSLHDTEDWNECWRRIAAPVLLLAAAEQPPGAALGNQEVLRARASQLRDLKMTTVADSGHNLHFDAPAIVARAIEEFLAEGCGPDG